MIEIYNKTPGFNKNIKQPLPSIEPYLLEDDKIHPSIIVVPGGGYCDLAPHEGEPIAKWLNTIGINAFVLTYRVAPYTHPYPLLDLQRSIRFLRYNHKEFNIDPKKLGVLGFSAGGHLAASACVHFDEETLNPTDEIDKISSRPDISVLCYPVISFLNYVHEGSKECLLGKKPSKDLLLQMSPHKQVKENTPPAFVWTTAEDNTVPMENSLLYVKALKDKDIPFELHIFPKGHHGLALKDEVPYVKRWAELCEQWFKEMKFIED